MTGTVTRLDEGARDSRAPDSAPGRIRTYDQRIRRPLLYPLSYGGAGSSVSVPRGQVARDGRAPRAETLVLHALHVGALRHEHEYEHRNGEHEEAARKPRSLKRAHEGRACALDELRSPGLLAERDSGTDELVVKITDRETDEVIRQIPSEELLELSRHLEELRGNLVDTVS